MDTQKVITLLALTSIIPLTGCSEPKADPPLNPAPSSESPSRPVPPGIGFPDLSDYAPADHDTYFSGGQNYSGYGFVTPNGQTCSSNDYPDPEYARIQCWGPRPNEGPGLWLVTAERRSPATIRQLTAAPDPRAVPPPELPPQHVLKYPKDELVCGVDGGITACRIGDHGFVLTPDRTTLF